VQALKIRVDGLESSLNAITEKSAQQPLLEEQALRVLVQQPYSLQ
jgi:hypothetical protein